MFKEIDDAGDNDYQLDHIDQIFLPDYETLSKPYVTASFIMPNGRTQKSVTELRDLYKDPMFLKLLARAASKQAHRRKHTEETRALASEMTIIV